MRGWHSETVSFPDYELEEEPLGCRPKYPLIFGLKHGIEVHSHLHPTRQDEGLDVNVRDADGMTALHHAVFNKYTWVVKVLMQRDDLKYYKNNEGQTPLQLATATGTRRDRRAHRRAPQGPVRSPPRARGP